MTRYCSTSPHTHTLAAAARFQAAFWSGPFSYPHEEPWEVIEVRFSWPASLEQQARGRLLRPNYAALDPSDLNVHLKMSYPRGLEPVTIVSGGPDGRLEDFAKVFYSDAPENCRVVLDFGPLLEARTEIVRAVGDATGLDPPSPLQAPAPHAQGEGDRQLASSSAA